MHTQADMQLRKYEETIKDEESIINNIQPQGLKTKNSRQSFIDVLAPSALSVVPERQPERGFHDLKIQSKASMLETTHEEITDHQQENHHLQGLIPNNQPSPVEIKQESII